MSLPRRATVHRQQCCTGSALDGPAPREVSFVGYHITSCGRSVGTPKVGVDSPKQCQSVACYLHAVIAVRYPELDNVQNDLICFGNYLLGEQATSGGFLPLFWDAPSAYMHAATDIGSAVDWLQSQVELNSDENGCLAVLHNRNKMVATFGNSEWVTQSDGFFFFPR